MNNGGRLIEGEGNAEEEALDLQDVKAAVGERPIGIDLSGGSLPPAAKDAFTIGNQEWEHRKSQQLSAFSISVAFRVILYIAAILFAGTALYLASEGRQVDWHTWLIPLSFLLPPTIITISLLKGVYPKGADDRHVVDETPTLGTVKEICQTIRDVCK